MGAERKQMSKVSNRAQLAKKIGLSDTDLEELFSYFDTDGSGNVEPDEFATLLAACGLPLRENMVDAIVSQIDTDHDGKISFDEFADFFVARDWGFDAANMTEEDKLRFATGRQSESKLGEFEWDFGLTYDDNMKALCEAKLAEEMTGSVGTESDVMERHHQMLKVKLLLPLWIKQLSGTSIKPVHTIQPAAAKINSAFRWVSLK